MIFTVPRNLHNVARPRLKSLIRIALENSSVVYSKAYVVAFKTLMSIIFQVVYSRVFFLFILCVPEGLKWSERNGKFRLENIESRPRVSHSIDHFFWTHKMTTPWSHQNNRAKHGFWLVYRSSNSRGSLETKFCLVGGKASLAARAVTGGSGVNETLLIKLCLWMWRKHFWSHFCEISCKKKDNYALQSCVFFLLPSLMICFYIQLSAII